MKKKLNFIVDNSNSTDAVLIEKVKSEFGADAVNQETVIFGSDLKIAQKSVGSNDIYISKIADKQVPTIIDENAIAQNIKTASFISAVADEVIASGRLSLNIKDTHLSVSVISSTGTVLEDITVVYSADGTANFTLPSNIDTTGCTVSLKAIPTAGN